MGKHSKRWDDCRQKYSAVRPVRLTTVAESVRDKGLIKGHKAEGNEIVVNGNSKGDCERKAFCETCSADL